MRLSRGRQKCAGRGGLTSGRRQPTLVGEHYFAYRQPLEPCKVARCRLVGTRKTRGWQAIEPFELQQQPIKFNNICCPINLSKRIIIRVRTLLAPLSTTILVIVIIIIIIVLATTIAVSSCQRNLWSKSPASSISCSRGPVLTGDTHIHARNGPRMESDQPGRS